MNRLNDIVAALTKQFADKAETKKALKLLERQLKNLYDLFMTKGGNPTDEDAMFNKKHLCGYSCASYFESLGLSSDKDTRRNRNGFKKKVAKTILDRV